MKLLSVWIKLGDKMKNTIIILMLLFTINIYADSKVFVREYTYNASDDDSKNSSRQRARNSYSNQFTIKFAIKLKSFALANTFCV